MLWYLELAVETFLFALLWYRDAPRWFSILICSDCIAQLMQIIFYRANFVEFARIFSRSGDALIAVPCLLALIEAADLDHGRFRWWHIRILSFWVVGAKLCGWMEVGQDASVVGWWNGILLAVQGLAFAAWVVLLYSDKRA